MEVNMKQEQPLPFESQAMNDETRWRAVVERDSGFDGAIFYGVLSTGIYCKPSCPSRRAARQQVVFFDTHGDAESAGFRPCLRCRPRAGDSGDAKLQLARRACSLIDTYVSDVPSLAELGAALNVSPFYLQRTFKKVLGVSPRQYALARRVNQFKRGIRKGGNVTVAMYDAGYGSSSRLYEKSDSEFGMTPASYARGGAGAHITYTTAPCELGYLLMAATERGLCAVRLGDSEEELETALCEEFPEASLSKDSDKLAQQLEEVLRHLAGELPDLNLPLDVRATAFQRRVWSCLQSIPYGEVKSYGEVAESIGHPKAVRAVASACAGNSVALVIPCHRVVRATGEPGGYRWGLKRKRALIETERRHSK
jgi:AraC family transcriptional regulator of adaptative response/methylated-DNA-[protein]-cysteine methyltransferase